jgi:UDP-GlcNAc:undecaprenyl-phosphate GlcNAc-1-phosphate transferase
VTYAVAFILSFAIAALLTPVVRGLAPAMGGIDRAKSSRKVHRTPIPRVGGLAIVAGFYAPLFGMFIYVNDISTALLRDKSLLVGLLGGGLAIATLGFLDDLYGVRARVKFVVQIVVALALWKLGFQIHEAAGIPLGLLALPVTVLWIVGIINAFNLIDGLDGLAGGVAAIAIGLNFAIAFARPDVLMCLFMASLAGAVIGFLLYNFNPATIFMGDSGSMFLGFVLACTSIVSSQKSSAAVSMLVPVIGLGLPIVDTLLAMIRRSLRGRPIFSADREHIHHRLLELGFTHRQAVLTLYGTCLTLAVMALGLSYAQGFSRAIVLTLAALVIIGGLRRLGYLRITPDSARRTAELRARNLNLRGVVRDIGTRMRGADRVEVVWDAVKYLAPALNAREMKMSVVLRMEAGEEVRSIHSWRDPDRPEPVLTNTCMASVDLELRTPVAAADRVMGDIVVTWTDGRRQVDRDDEIALEMLKAHVENALERIEPAAVDVPVATGKVIELRRRNEG